MSNKEEILQSFKNAIKAIEKVDEEKYHYIHLPEWNKDMWLIGFPRGYRESSAFIKAGNMGVGSFPRGYRKSSVDQITFGILCASEDLNDRNNQSEYENDGTYFAIQSMWEESSAHTFNMGYDIVAEDSTIIRPIEINELPLYISGKYKHVQFDKLLKGQLD